MSITEEQANGWRKDRNASAIKNEVDISYVYQVGFPDKLAGLFPQYVWQYPKSRAEESGRAFDVLLNSRVKIELECGTKQTDWIDSLGDVKPHWNRGLSVATRKALPGRWDIFIKYNMNLNSFFAFTYEFFDATSVLKTGVKHSLGYKTNDSFVSVPWDKIVNDPTRMVYDDFGLLEEMFKNSIDKKSD